MAFAIPLIGGLAASAVVSKVLAPKAPKVTPVATTPAVQVRTSSAVSDALSSRTGSRVNQRTGPRGAEAGTGSKTKLGQ